MVELEIRELLEDFGFDGNGAPVIFGSALEALNDKDTEYGVKSINQLLDTIDEYIPDPERDLKSPFMLPIDNAFLVPGRGTVVVGTLNRGILKKNTEGELVGFNIQLKSTASDIQVFKKSVPQVHIILYVILRIKYNFFNIRLLRAKMLVSCYVTSN